MATEEAVIKNVDHLWLKNILIIFFFQYILLYNIF